MTLKIHLLGQFKISNNDQPLDLPSRPAQSLLAYLVLNPGFAHRREKLAGLLWPDSTETNARNYLRQALWRIRKTLDGGSLTWEDFLEINKISVTFKPETDYWLDVAGLIRKDDALSPEQLGGILECYQGELLPGFYDEWVGVERDRVQAAFHQKINLLIGSLLKDGQWDQVLAWSEHWIRHGHAPEAGFRALMQAYAGLGDLDMVRVAFDRCTEALERELGIPPSHETEQMLAEFMGQTAQPPAQSAPLPGSPAIRRPAFLEEPFPAERDELPFVAREKELKELKSHLDDILSNQGKVIFVTGEAGSGKTTLLREFSRHALETHLSLIVVSGNCNAHTGPGDPYLPLREILGQLTGDVEPRLQAGALTLEHARRLWELIPQTIPAVMESGVDLINTLSSGNALLNRARASVSAGESWLLQLEDIVSRKEGVSLLPGPQQSDLFEQYSRVLRNIAQKSPIILIIDDLQWADPGSIGMVFHLGRQLSGAPILIIGSYRMEDVAAGREGERHPLEPLVNEFKRLYGPNTINLGQSDRRHFIDALLDSEPNRLGLPFREMLFHHTQGHPLFTIELLRGMQERGDLILENDIWTEGSALDWETVPARVEAVIAERIGRLPEALQSVLRVASVEGEIFTNEVVARVLDQDERKLLSRLSGELDKKHRLIMAESIHRFDGRVLSNYRFRNILFQKFLYSSLDKVERTHTHERIALILETLCAEVDEYPDVVLQLARHFEEAGLIQKAIQYLHQAGERAISISACPEGIVHLQSGLSLLKTLPHSSDRDEKELEMQLSIVKAWKHTGPSPEARQAMNRSRELCTKLGRMDQLSRVFGELTIYHYVMARYDEAIKFAREALALAIDANDPVLQVEGHWLLGLLNYCLGEFPNALSHLKKVADFYDPYKQHHPFVKLRGVDVGLSAMAYEAACLHVLGFQDQAEQRGTEAIQLATGFDHPFTLADVLCFAGCMLNEMRDDGEALHKAASALKQITDEKKLDGWLGHSTRYLGTAQSLLGMSDQAIKTISEGIHISEKTNELLYKAVTLCSLAKAKADMMEFEEGLATIDEALNIVEKTGERLWEAELHRVRAWLLRELDDQTGAEASLQKARKISQNQSAKSWELRASIDLARLWHEQGKDKHAKQMLSKIYEWFTEGFDGRDLREAKSLLDML